MTTTPASVPNPDPRPTYVASLATCLDVVSRVSPSHLAAHTPCTEFDVRGLLGHMLTVLGRTTALGNGTDPFAMPDVQTGVDDSAWMSTFMSAAADTLAAWSADGVLDRQMTLPWAQVPGRAMLATYTSELTVHTWDLSQAIGYRPTWNRDAVEESLVASAHLLPPGDRTTMTLPTGQAIPFDNAVEVSAEAPAIDRLVAWYGRDPLRGGAR